MDRGAWQAVVHGVIESDTTETHSDEMQEMGDRSLGGEDPLEEAMATHSSVLARRIP